MTELIEQKTGITKGGTFLSLGLVCAIVIAMSSAIGWVNGMDARRGQQLNELSERVTRVETSHESTSKTLERIEQQLDDIHKHLIESR